MLDRASLTRQLMDLQPKVNKAFEDHRYVVAHGRLPDAPVVEEKKVDPIELYQRISNLRKSLSKDRKKEQKPAVVQRIEDKEKQLESLLKEYADARPS